MNAVMTPVDLGREAPPLHQDADGVIRVAATRVTLESIVSLYEQGASAEEIALRFDVLSLSDIYATVAYFLGHRPEMESYLDRMRQASLDARGQSRRRTSSLLIRERLGQYRKRDDASAPD